jgi:acetyl esterase/lipase
VKRSLLKWLGRLAIGLAALAVVLALGVRFTPQGRAALHTGLFVTQVLNLPFKPQSWFTANPVRQEVTYPQGPPSNPALPRRDTGGYSSLTREDYRGVADLYRIADGKPRAAVLIFLGANAAGRDDPDVVNLGNALARAGFVAMFHWSPTMALQHNIDPNEIENLVWAFQYLRGQDGVDEKRVGMGGFCVGASFALVAAADPRISGDVTFVNAFGPYYDARDLLLQVSARSRFYRGRAEAWEPDPLTLRVFANELIEALDNPQDRDNLGRIFLENQAVSADELAHLSPTAQGVHRLLMGVGPEEAETLYLVLPTQFRQNMARISPSAHLLQLKARISIMHDRNDRLVPAAESRRLADALRPRGDFRYTEVLAFEHVRPTSGGGLWTGIREGYKLFRHMYGIIRVAS